MINSQARLEAKGAGRANRNARASATSAVRALNSLSRLPKRFFVDLNEAKQYSVMLHAMHLVEKMGNKKGIQPSRSFSVNYFKDSIKPILSK